MTADMGPLMSAADEYGDQRFAEGVASRQAEVDDLASAVRVTVEVRAGRGARPVKRFLSCEQLWFACMWNATTGKGHVLTGDRLAAFKAPRADARVRR